MDELSGETTPAGTAELATAAPRVTRGRAAVAAAIAVAVALGGIALAATRDTKNTGARRARPLALLSGAAAMPSGARDAALMPVRPTRYVHEGQWQSLPDSATAFRLGAPSSRDAAARLARALGITGAAARTGDGWQISTGEGTLTWYETDGGWLVSFSTMGPSVSPGRGPDSAGGAGASSGSSGSGSAGSTGSTGVTTGSNPAEPGSAGSGTTDTKPAPDEPPATVTTQPPAPQDLPSRAEAERIARRVLSDAGIEGEWDATVNDGSSIGSAVACPDAADCQTTPEQTIVLTRSVLLQRVVDGLKVEGLDWYVEIGDHGAVTSVSGRLASLTGLGSYPLRGADAAFADLAAGRTFFGGGIAPMAADAAASRESSSSTGGPEPEPQPEPVVVTIDGIALGLAVNMGIEDGQQVTYVVPVYRFHGTVAGGGEASALELALSDEFVTTPSTTVPPTVIPPDTKVPPASTEPYPVPQPGPLSTVPGTVVAPPATTTPELAAPSTSSP